MTRRLGALALIAIAVGWTYYPALDFPFLNWDDDAVIVQNPSLEFPGVIRWAFTTTYMEHYQPLSWLAWATIKRGFGLDASAFHLANVVAHVACVLLVWMLARRVLVHAAPERPPREREAAALAAALLYGLHPLRAEVVAWVSALPYSLALALAIASALAYLRTARQISAWWIVAVLLYAASLAARPVALGFPLVLIVLDIWLLGRTARASLGRAWPFAVLAAAAAVIESVARLPGLNPTPWAYRLQSAVSAPFVYIWRTLAPVALTPLDLLPIEPVASAAILLASILALVVVSFAIVWKWRWPAVVAAWAMYLALLAPATGLLPSGLQATADRYTYLPGVVIAVAVAAAGVRWAAGRTARVRLVVLGMVVLIVASSVATRRTLAWWSGSVVLWSRVVSLNPRHDVGLYNLAAALATAGREAEAAARYRELLALQPAHGAAQANLDRLDAVRLEREGNDFAARGELATAAERYRQATALDPQRTHSHAGRGMALASLGRVAEATPALREAIRQGVDDPAIPNALAVLLLQDAQTREARAVLETALARHQNDVGLAHNLARLLATRPDPERAEGDAALALKLAVAVVEATREQDARALDTLATALAANGREAEAAAASDRAARVAAAQGDRDLAVQITARGRAYRRPGR